MILQQNATNRQFKSSKSTSYENKLTNTSATIRNILQQAILPSPL